MPVFRKDPPSLLRKDLGSFSIEMPRMVSAFRIVNSAGSKGTLGAPDSNIFVTGANTGGLK